MACLRRPTAHMIALLAFLFWFVGAVTYLRHLASNDPGSLFFDPKHAFDRRYSFDRQLQADYFIANTSQPYSKAADKHSMCVGILTVQRDGTRYFRYAVGSVLAGLSVEERADVYLTTFIVDVDPTQHQAYEEDWLHSLSDRVLTYNEAPADVLQQVRAFDAEDPLFFKTKPLFDYVHLLKTCYANGAPYIVMLEDDVIAVDGWYARTKAALKDLETNHDKASVMYLRLFYNERLLGWNNEEWLRYLMWSISAEAVLVAVVLGIRRFVSSSAVVLMPRTIATVCLLCGPLCVALYFAAGRLTVAGLPTGISRMDKYGCCSQAFVFHRERVPDLITYFETSKSGFVDVLTEKYANEKELARWALTPSVFQHVGSKSSKWGTKGKWGRYGAENIWNFRFEDYDADALKRASVREHHHRQEAVG